MSAIFGIWRYDGGEVSASELERMGNALAHRGPDGRKSTINGPVGLGHCLMRVNREDYLEAQPLRDREADLSLVADCRIDNREELAGIFGIGTTELRETSDSVLVLRAFKKWGEECAGHLLGDFAFAVWDGRAKKLVLGRDHMGQRNVYYHKGENFFAFATEIKGLWALAEVPRELLDQELARIYLNTVRQKPEDRTLYAGIHSVPGGTVVVAKQDRSVAPRRYWTPHADLAHEGRDENYYVEKYRSVLAEAVACRLRRLIAPAALLMSAGFDSAAIAGLAGPVVAAQGRKLISLSWFGSKATETEYGDIRPWLQACQRVMPHLDIREVSSEEQNPLVGIERRFLINEGPAHSPHNITDDLFAKAARAGARLIMDGFGGDYSLNPRGHEALARHLRRGQFRRFLTELRPHLRQTGRSAWQMLKYDIIMMQFPILAVRWQRRIRRQARWGRFALLSLRYGTALRYVQGPYLEELQKRNAAEAKRGFESLPITAMRARMRDIARGISRGSKAGGAVPAAAQGLELTRPFHDKRVLELALAIPEDLYVKNGLNRYLARLALADVYPQEFQTRGRKNEGVLADDLAILNTATPELLAEVDRLANSPKLSGYFDFERVRRLLSLPGPNRRGPTAAIKFAAVNAVLTARFIEWFSPSNTR